MTEAPAAEAGAIHTHILSANGLNFTALEAGSGPLVLLLHGFPDGPQTFTHQLTALAAAGFRAVAVTLRGYELSSRPKDGSYRLVHLAQDVIGWIDALGERSAHLIGHDWGATIAYAAAVTAPDRVLSLTMIAVPHPLRLAQAIRSDPAQRRRSGYILFFQLRGLSDWWVRRRRAAYLVTLWRRWSPTWAPPSAHLDAIRARFSDALTCHAALDYYRQALDRAGDAASASAALVGGVVAAGVLGIVGAEDGCIGSDVFTRSMTPDDFPGGLEIIQIGGAGHFVHAEAPGAVNPAIVAFLRRSSAHRLRAG